MTAWGALEVPDQWLGTTAVDDTQEASQSIFCQLKVEKRLNCKRRIKSLKEIFIRRIKCLEF